MPRSRIRHRVLAVDPTHWGFGFVVLENGGRLVEWGSRDADPSHRNDRCVTAVGILMVKYVPSVLALEDWTAPSSHRRARVLRLLARLRAEGLRRRCRVSTIALAVVRRRLGLDERATKHNVASVLAARFPELEQYLPRPRKLWETEHPRMSLFTALGLAVAAVEPRNPRGP